MLSSARYWFNHIWRESAIVLLVVAGLVLAAAALWPPLYSHFDSRSAAHRAYNEGVVLLAKGDIAEAQERFTESISLANEDSGTGASARYNLALAMLAQEELDSEVLFRVREILEDALRLAPQDTDIRKNLELVQNLLRQTLEEELIEMGGDPGDAEEMMDEFAPQYPSDGERPGRDDGNERSY